MKKNNNFKTAIFIIGAFLLLYVAAICSTPFTEMNYRPIPASQTQELMKKLTL